MATSAPTGVILKLLRLMSRSVEDADLDRHRWMRNLHETFQKFKAENGHSYPWKVQWREARSAVRANIERMPVIHSLLTILSDGPLVDKALAAEVLAIVVDALSSWDCEEFESAVWFRGILAIRALPALLALLSQSLQNVRCHAAGAIHAILDGDEALGFGAVRETLPELVAMLDEGTICEKVAALKLMEHFLWKWSGDSGLIIKAMIQTGCLERWRSCLLLPQCFDQLFQLFHELTTFMVGQFHWLATFEVEEVGNQEDYLCVKTFMVGKMLPRIVSLLRCMSHDDNGADWVTSALQCLVAWACYTGSTAKTAIASNGGIDVFLHYADELENEGWNHIWNRFFDMEEVREEKIKLRIDDPNAFWHNPAAQFAHRAWRDRKHLRDVLIVVRMRMSNETIDSEQHEVFGVGDMMQRAIQYHSQPGVDLGTLGNMLQEAASHALCAPMEQLIKFVCGRLQRSLCRSILQYI